METWSRPDALTGQRIGPSGLSAAGVQRLLDVPPRAYAHPTLLPDESDAIVEIEVTQHDLWRYDVQTGAMTLLARGSSSHRAVLSADGTITAFSADRDLCTRRPAATSGPSTHRQTASGSCTSENLA